jgi:acetyl-CoA carboxylase biotin carboxyl carrier protein
MTIAEIKELLEVFNAAGVEEIEVQRGENRLRIRRGSVSHEYVAGPTQVPVADAAAPAAPHAALASPVAPNTPGGTAAAPAPAKATGLAASESLVKSPIVGTYYDQPSPGAPPFVKVGDAVEPGQVLCIIESMKLMNEIEAEVEYGEALFAVRPRS